MIEILRTPALALTIAGSTLLGVGCTGQEVDVATPRAEAPTDNTVKVDAATVRRVESCVLLYERKITEQFGSDAERISLITCMAMKSCLKDEKPSEVALQVEQGSESYSTSASDIVSDIDEVADRLDLRNCVVQRVYGSEDSGYFEKEILQGMPPNLNGISAEDFRSN